MKTTFGVMAAFQVKLINSAQACNFYFIVESSATVVATAVLQGNILAYTSIAVNSGSSNHGNFLCSDW